MFVFYIYFYFYGVTEINFSRPSIEAWTQTLGKMCVRANINLGTDDMAQRLGTDDMAQRLGTDDMAHKPLT